MAFLLKDKIFGFFGRDIKKRDSYKDSEGKGFLQRYNEVMGEEYDTYYGVYLDNLVDYTLVPKTVLDKFIPYLEQMFGGLQFSGTTLATRRKIVSYALVLYNIKGTKKSYDLIYRLLGFDSVTIVEHIDEYSFDSPVTFDDFYRRFDSKCPACSAYTINVYGDLTLDDDLHKMIFRAAELCEPINATLRAVFYNGTLLISDDLPSIFIDVNGDLQYENVAAPEIEFELTLDGDLLVNEGGFSINANGDIIFNN